MVESKEDIGRLKSRIAELEGRLETDGDASSERGGLLQSLLDNVLDGITTIEESGAVRSFNRPAEDIFGRSDDQVIGRNVEMLMPEHYRSQNVGYLTRYLATGDRRIIGIGREFTGLRKDGSTFPMDLAVSEFPFNGECMFTGIVRNIADRTRLEEHRCYLLTLPKSN